MMTRSHFHSRWKFSNGYIVQVQFGLHCLIFPCELTEIPSRLGQVAELAPIKSAATQNRKSELSPLHQLASPSIIVATQPFCF
jgi:hypothetical protein